MKSFSMKIITKQLAEEIFEAANDNGNKVTVDMRKREEKGNLSPTELVLSALASCAGVDIASMLKKRKKTIQAFVIESDGTRREDPPRYFTKIHCTFIITSPDVTEEELQKVAGLAIEKYCSVASSLKADITHSAKVLRP